MQPVPNDYSEIEFDRDLSAALGRTSSPVDVNPPEVSVSGPQARLCNGVGPAGLLAVELEVALKWFYDLRVDLELYEGASLLLQEPLQRARLVRFVVEQARSFRESGRPELTLSWRDHPALVAVDSIRFDRTAR